jgi:NADH-quinone oxidoreductase subunit L
MLEYAWVVPAITFTSFWIILLFGKKLPMKGAEVGIGALVMCFVLSVALSGAWISRTADLEVEAHKTVETGEHGSKTDDHGGESDSSGDHGGGGDHRLVLPSPAPLVMGAAEGGEGGHHSYIIREPVQKEWTWFSNGQIDIKAGIHIDGLAVALLFVVSTISLLVHIFSTSYVHGDERFTHYFAFLSLFTTGMFVLVTASNTLQALFGWELMGLCSFGLIGHWWEQYPNARAALKAFFTTRTGDVGLLVGISILFFAAGETFDIASTNAAAIAGEIPDGVLIAAAAALLVAVIGKSAQFPLHTWLPDAMAGPTPVSALIHAATMVVAGVYLIARLYGVFWEAFDIADGGFNAIAIVGGITILIAAALAFVQRDIKKVLAYSTVSQLGFMVMALGVGAWTAAIFHLFTHAFFKACLFLGAGSVSHSGSHHSFDMVADMGGLKKYMPKTFWTFATATLALAGVPPLAGFWSKDEILLGAGENGYTFFLVVGLVGAFMTAAYMTRCVYLTFFGEPRGAAAHHHPHESPSTITIPLIILAVLSVFAGLLNAPGILKFTEWTDNITVITAGMEHHDFSIITALFSVVVGLGGILTAYAYYWKGFRVGVLKYDQGISGSIYRFLGNKYYLDDLYEKGVVAGVSGPVARAAYWINQKVLDGVVNGAGVTARGLARFVYEIGTGYASEGAGAGLRVVQTGKVQQYAVAMFIGVIAFAGLLVVFV